VLRFIMESGAKGCEVIVSGKLRAQRAKAMKFKDGFMVSSGEPVRQYIDAAVRHVMLRQGVLGIKVRCLQWTRPSFWERVCKARVIAILMAWSSAVLILREINSLAWVHNGLLNTSVDVAHTVVAS
jgi:hypothetical protein